MSTASLQLAKPARHVHLPMHRPCAVKPHRPPLPALRLTAVPSPPLVRCGGRRVPRAICQHGVFTTGLRSSPRCSWRQLWNGVWHRNPCSNPCASPSDPNCCRACHPCVCRGTPRSRWYDVHTDDVCMRVCASACLCTLSAYRWDRTTHRHDLVYKSFTCDAHRTRHASPLRLCSFGYRPPTPTPPTPITHTSRWRQCGCQERIYSPTSRRDCIHP